MLLASELSRVFHGLLVNPTIGPRSCEPLNSSHYSLRSTIRRAQVPPVIPMERPDAPQACELHIVIVVNSNIPSRFSTLLSWVSSTSNMYASGLFRHDTPKLRTHPVSPMPNQVQPDHTVPDRDICAAPLAALPDSSQWLGAPHQSAAGFPSCFPYGCQFAARVPPDLPPSSPVIHDVLALYLL